MDGFFSSSQMDKVEYNICFQLSKSIMLIIFSYMYLKRIWRDVNFEEHLQLSNTHTHKLWVLEISWLSYSAPIKVGGRWVCWQSMVMMPMEEILKWVCEMWKWGRRWVFEDIEWWLMKRDVLYVVTSKKPHTIKFKSSATSATSVSTITNVTNNSKDGVEKAFDKVSWKFIDYMLMKKNFSTQWRRWIKSCIISVQYSMHYH